MKNIFVLIAAAIMIVTAGSAREFKYEAGPFDKVSVLGNVNVVYRSVTDSVGIVAYDADKDYGEALEISNNKGKLTVKETTDHGLGVLPTIRVYSDYISQIRNEGNSVTKVELSAATPTLNVRLVGNGRIVCENVASPEVKASLSTGNGDIVLRGRCRRASFDLAGTGVIQADSLEADYVKCNVIGTGSIGCWALDNLDVRGIGTTKIYYRGNPIVKKVGGARMTPIYEEPTTSVINLEESEGPDVGKVVTEDNYGEEEVEDDEAYAE